MYSWRDNLCSHAIRHDDEPYPRHFINLKQRVSTYFAGGVVDLNLVLLKHVASPLLVLDRVKHDQLCVL